MFTICPRAGRENGRCSDGEFLSRDGLPVPQVSAIRYFLTVNQDVDMGQPDTATMMKRAAGVAGGAALLAPVAPPLLHGLAGLAVVGLGIFAAGSLVFKAAEVFQGMENPLKPKGEEPKIP